MRWHNIYDALKSLVDLLPFCDKYMSKETLLLIPIEKW